MTEIVVNCATGETTVRASPAVALPDAKVKLWDRAKARRDAKIDGGVTVPGIGRFDTDEKSRLNIAGATTGALMAQLAGQPFSITWRLADNTVATLDAAQMLAVGKAVLTHVATAHANAQGLAVSIEAAADANGLPDISQGW